MEVTQIFIANRMGNPVYIPICCPQKKRRLLQPFFLNQLGKILSCLAFDLPGKPIIIVPKQLRSLC